MFGFKSKKDRLIEQQQKEINQLRDDVHRLQDIIHRPWISKKEEVPFDLLKASTLDDFGIVDIADEIIARSLLDELKPYIDYKTSVEDGRLIRTGCVYVLRK